MTKLEFLAALRNGLAGLPQEDIDERVAFYAEMLDDRMEEGLTEQQAVAAAGSVEKIVAGAVAETPFVKIAKEKIRTKRRLHTGEIVLLVLGSPLWLSLGIAAVAVVLSLYVSLWAVIVSLWSVFASFAACAVGGALSGIVLMAGNNTPSGLAMLAAGLVCAGLAILAFYGCKAATKGVARLTKNIAVWTKNRFRGGQAQ